MTQESFSPTQRCSADPQTGDERRLSAPPITADVAIGDVVGELPSALCPHRPGDISLSQTPITVGAPIGDVVGTIGA